MKFDINVVEKTTKKPSIIHLEMNLGFREELTGRFKFIFIERILDEITKILTEGNLELCKKDQVEDELDSLFDQRNKSEHYLTISTTDAEGEIAGATFEINIKTNELNQITKYNYAKVSAPHQAEMHHSSTHQPAEAALDGEGSDDTSDGI